jgi:hypothetical protein
MIIYMSDTSHFLKVSKSIKKALDDRGIPTKLAAAREIAARLYGYSSSHEFHKTCATSPASPWDQDVAASEAANRRAQYVGTLVSLGIDRAVADAIVEEVSPTSRRKISDVDWVLVHQKSSSGTLKHWLPELARFRRTPSYHEFLQFCFTQVSEEKNWAEHYAYHEYKRGDAWIFDQLDGLSRSPHHELWPPSIVTFLAVALRPSGLGQMMHDVEFLEQCSEAVAAADSARLDSLLRSCDLLQLAFIFRQMIPSLLASSYAAEFGRADVPPESLSFTGRPAKEAAEIHLQTWLDYEKEERDGWRTLVDGDLEAFCSAANLSPPEVMYFRKVLAPSDPDLASMGLKGKHQNILASIGSFEPDGPHHIRDTVLVAESEDDEDVTPCGLFQVEHNSTPSDGRHVMSVPYIIAMNEDAAMAAVASICMSTIDVRRDWKEALMPGTAVKLVIEVGAMEKWVRDILYESLAMAEDNWDIWDLTYRMTMEVRSKGRVVNHRR